MWIQAYEVDFNDPRGHFAIEEDAPDYRHGDAFPHVGDEVFLVCMESSTHHRAHRRLDAGFGMICRVTSEEVRTLSSGRTLRFYETDHFQRRFRTKP